MLESVARIVSVALGAALALELMRDFSRYWQDDQLGYVSASIVAVFVFAGLGYIIGGIAGRWLERATVRVETAIHRYSISDIVLGFIGLVMGLAVSALVSLSIRGINVIGVYAPPLIFIIGGYLGLRIALRRRDELESKLPFLADKRIGRDGVSHVSVSPKIVDTSIVIDGRLAGVLQSGFVEGEVVIATFVVQELQRLADSRDDLKREKGRRGLDLLKELQDDPSQSIKVLDEPLSSAGVDSQLLQLAKECDGTIVTKDYNLQKVAEVAGIKVLNINQLTNAVKSAVVSGEALTVAIIEAGKEEGQGVGYLEDGTMVVVDQARSLIGSSQEVIVSNVLQTAAGRLVFARIAEGENVSG